MTRIQAAATTTPLAGLTGAELDVLALMADGLTNRCIAARLWISPKTVETRIGVVFRKLGLHEDADENRRVRAVLTYLPHAAPAPVGSDVGLAG